MKFSFKKPDASLAALCKVCSRIFVGRWARRPLEWWDPDPSEDSFADHNSFSEASDPPFDRHPVWGKVENGKVVVQMHYTLAALKVAVSDGCQLCNMIYDQLDQSKDLLWDHDRGPDWNRLSGAVGVVEVRPNQIPDDIQADDNTTDFDLFSLNVKYYDNGQYDEEDTKLLDSAGFALRLAGPRAHASLGKPKSIFEPHPHVIQNIKDWARACLLEHSKCKGSPTALSLPTRLLCVSDRGKKVMRLCEAVSIASRPRYVTLSHCWGRNLPFRLLRGNYRACLNGIRESELPLTFQHAAMFARQLGIEYIWIDALCIIQDSKEDWATESLRMADIYKNGYLNIAASSSVDGHGGLFRIRNHTLIAPCLIETVWGGSGGRSVPARYYCISESNFWDRVLRAPLNRRAWVFQERVLAPRTVHFARDQVWWQCGESVHCEAFPQGVAQHLYSENVLMSLQTKASNRDRQAANRVWLNTVEEYMMSRITYDSDRLIALAGIAIHMQNMLGWQASDYKAGLWRHGFPADLLWDTPGDRSRTQSPYVAPSWSWASMRGRVEFHKDVPVDQLYATLLDVQTGFDHSPFGPSRGGHLTLHAEVHSLIFSESDPDWHEFFFFNKLAQVDGVEIDCEYNGSLDDLDVYPREGGSLSTVWCIIARTPDGNEHLPKTDIIGLLLRPVKQESGRELYSRIGLMTVTERVEGPLVFSLEGSLSRGKEKKVVTIV